MPEPTLGINDPSKRIKNSLVSIITISGVIANGAVTTGWAIVTGVSCDNTVSHASTIPANSRPVLYNKKMRKKAESMGIPAWLQNCLVLEQLVSKWRRLGVSLAHRGHAVVSFVS